MAGRGDGPGGRSLEPGPASSQAGVCPRAPSPGGNPDRGPAFRPAPLRFRPTRPARRPRRRPAPRRDARPARGGPGGAAPVPRRRARRGPHRARRHRHRPGGRGPRRGRGGPARRARRGRPAQLGDPARTSASRHGRTPWAAGSPSSAAWPPPTRPAWSSRPRAASSSPSPPASARSSRSACASATPTTSTRCSCASSSSPTPASRWSPRAASSRCAAASSTSSRPTAEHPVRVEFWGDEVSELRAFTVADQRSTHPVDVLDAPGCRELLLTDPVRERAAALARTHENNPPLRELLGAPGPGHPERGHGVAHPRAGRGASCSCSPTCCPRARWCSSPTRSGCAPAAPTSCAPARSSWRRAGSPRAWAAAPRSTSAPRPTATSATCWSTPRPPATRWSRSARCCPGATDALVTGAHEVTAYRGDIDRALVDLRAHVATGGAAVLMLGGHGTAQRAMEQLREAEVPAVLADELSDEPEKGLVTVTCGRIVEGFTAGLLVVLTEADLTGNRAAVTETRKLASRRRNAVDLVTLKPGDYVVHAQHGIGRFVEMRQRTVQGATREYLVLEYASSKRGQPADRLFVPTDALDEISRYVGGEVPTLNKLGGADWAKTKGRARKAVRQIAAQLVQLYAARQAAPGTRSRKDTPWQRELEDAFPYTETPDQLSAIDEVKADMERPGPDGPGDLRRRRVRQDRDRGARGVQGRAGRQAGGGARADHAARQPAPGHLHRAHARVPRQRPGPVPVHRRRRGARDDRGPRRGHGRRRHRHPPAAADRRALEGPRAGHRRRGAALRRRAQGAHHGAAHARRRADALRDPDPAHAGDEPRRHPGDVDDHHPARGPPPDAHLRGRLRRQAGRRRDPPRAAARRPGVLRAQPGVEHRPGGPARAGPRAGGARRRRARPDERGPAGTHGGRLLAQRVRRAGVHHDRRERAGHLQRQHADRRALRHARALRSCTSCAAGSGAAASAATPTSCSRPSTRSPRPRTTGSPRSRSTPSWARARPSR